MMVDIRHSLHIFWISTPQSRRRLWMVPKVSQIIKKGACDIKCHKSLFATQLTSKKNDMTFPYLTCVTNQCLVFVQKFLQFCRQSHGRILVWCSATGLTAAAASEATGGGAEYRQLTHSIVVVELVTRSLHHRLSSRRPLHSFGPNEKKPAKNQIQTSFEKLTQSY